MALGTQRTLARVSSASAIHVLAWAAATTSGRASERRRAVARLIGNRTSVGSRGAGLSVKRTSNGDGPSLTLFRSPDSPIWIGDVGGKAGGNWGTSSSGVGIAAGDCGARGVGVAPDRST